jgi:hypothetical protein
MSNLTYWPCILIVDDDRACTDFLRERFHRHTSVGVVVANTLKEGRKLLDDENIRIDAMVADLFFDDGTDDAAFQLFDGVDLVDYGISKRPKLTPYVMSFFCDKDDFRNKAKNKNIDLENWYPKLWQPGDHPDAIWSKVEQDLIKSRVAEDTDATLRGVRKLRLPHRTYLQEFPRGEAEYVLVEPIEVLCRCEKVAEGGEEAITYYAAAWRLGLIQEGQGVSVESALEDLGTVVADQVRAFRDIDRKKLGVYAADVLLRLDACVRPKVGTEL